MMPQLMYALSELLQLGVLAMLSIAVSVVQWTARDMYGWPTCFPLLLSTRAYTSLGSTAD